MHQLGKIFHHFCTKWVNKDIIQINDCSDMRETINITVMQNWLINGLVN